jgi:F-type H+-transporting ATPase subunit gamma
MPTLKEYNVKLLRLRSTRKMTKTMKMISASKLRKAQDIHRSAGAYAEAFIDILSTLGIDADQADTFPLLTPRAHVRDIHVVLFTSDRGLCGGFNNNLSRRLQRWVTERVAEGRTVTVSFCGRRGHMALRDLLTVGEVYEHISAHPSFQNACHIGRDVRGDFAHQRCDEVYLAFNRFFSVLSQRPVIEKLLPLDYESLLENRNVRGPIQQILEPSLGELLSSIVPRVINLKVYFALLSTLVGEHAARMTAMDNATRNADKMIDQITLRRNRARQSEITTELIEIVAGAEALK